MFNFNFIWPIKYTVDNTYLTQLIIPFLLYTLFSNYDTLLGLSLVDQLVRLILQSRRPGFDSWVGKIPWRRERLLTPVFWPGKFHGLYSLWGCKESDMTEWLSLHFTHFWPPQFDLKLCSPFIRKKLQHYLNCLTDN